MIPTRKRAEALRLVRRGHTIGDAAKRAGVSYRSLTRWIVAAQAEEPPPAEHTQPEASAPREPSDPRARPTELTRTILDESLQGAELARSDGNLTAASRFLKNAHSAAHDLVRAEREQAQTEDMISLSREEFDRYERQALDTLAALRADLERTGGLVCNNCGRSIRIALARGE